MCIVLLGDGDPLDSCQCKKVSGTKKVEEKVVGTVQKGYSRTKIGGDSRTSGVGDPKAKCKKVSGTKMRN